MSFASVARRLTPYRPALPLVLHWPAQPAQRAEALRGLKLYIPRDSLPEPEEDEFYLADLIGLFVETAEGEALGTVKAVQDFGAGDLLEIQPRAGATWWLPFTREAVPEVRLAQGKLIAAPPASLEADPDEGREE